MHISVRYFTCVLNLGIYCLTFKVMSRNESKLWSLKNKTSNVCGTSWNFLKQYVLILQKIDGQKIKVNKRQPSGNKTY